MTGFTTVPSRIDLFTEHFTRAAIRRRRLVLVLAILTLIAGVGLTSRLRIQGDFVELLPSASTAAQRFRAALARKGGGDSTLVVVVQSKDPDENRRFIDALAKDLQGLDPVLGTSIDAGPRETRAYVERYLWFFLSEDELDRIQCQLERARARLSPGYFEIDNPCDDDPAGATAGPSGARNENPIARFRAEVDRRVRAEDRFPDGYYRSPDGKSYALVVHARHGGMGEISSDRVLAEVSTRARRIAQTMNDLDVGFGGAIPTAVAEREALLDDIGVVSTAAILLVLGSIVLFFRSWRALFYMGLCVGVGTSVAFAFADLGFGRLNAATSFLGAIVVGNGINYCIVYMARYAEQRRHGLGVEQAVVDAAITCRRATWLAALAASLAYLSLATTAFRGFSEFGWIGGMGMVLCWLATFSVLPACIATFERSAHAGLGREPRERRSLPGWLTERAVRRPRTVTLACAVVSAALLWPIARYLGDPWEYDFGKLSSQSSSTSGASHTNSVADRIFGVRGAPILVLADRMSDAPSVARDILAADQELTGGRFVDKVDTIYTMLGGVPDVVRRKARTIDGIRDDLDVLSKHLEGDDLAFARKYRPPDGLVPPAPADLPDAIRRQYRESDGRTGTPIYVTLARNVSQSRGQNLLVISRILDRATDRAGAPLPSAGRAGVFAEMIASMTHDGPRASLLAFLAVIFVSMLVTRSLAATLCVLGSLVLGVVITVGSAALSQLRLNFLNFVALPLTFGIGVEYAINVVERARITGDIAAAGRSVGGAVALCSLTTIFGYGALLFADNRALQSFGRYAIVGEVACLGAALIALPAALVLVGRRRTASRRDTAETKLPSGC